jgi:hypothetical protein
MIENIQIKSYLHLATQSLIKVYKFKILTNTDSILKNLFKINFFHIVEVSKTPRIDFDFDIYQNSLVHSDAEM